MANYKTKKINGYNAVHIGDLPLQYGRISSQNSMPYIREEYIPKMMELDKQMGATGNRYKITSNIGGDHKGGPRSHANFEKMDIAPDQRAGFTSFNKAGTNYLNNNWVGNGAIGLESVPGSSPWYDLSFNAKGKGMDNIIRQQPNLMNAQPDIQTLYQTGQLNNLDYVKALQDEARRVAQQYDLARARNSAQQNIQDVTQAAVPQINEQMMTNVDDPIVFQMAQQRAQLNKDIARQNAYNTQNLAMREYYNQRTPEQMVNDYNAQVQRFLDTMNNQNPYRQVQGQVNPYQIDMNEVLKAQARDRSFNTADQALGILNAETNPRLAQALLQSAQQPRNEAEQLLRNAQLQYQAQVANQLGLPPEVIAKQAEHQMKMAEALAPGASSTYKEASVLQPNQNLRNLISEMPSNATDIYKDTIVDQTNNMSNLLDRNKLYKDINTPGGNAMVNSLGDITEMQGKYPQQVTDKMKAEMEAMTKGMPYAIQGNTSMTNRAIEDITKNAGNINTNLVKESEETGKDVRKMADIAQQQSKQKAPTPEDALKTANQKQNLVKSVLYNLTDQNSGELRPGADEAFVNALRDTGMFTDSEIVRLGKLYFQ